jgi:hypothetical protein
VVHSESASRVKVRCVEGGQERPQGCVPRREVWVQVGLVEVKMMHMFVKMVGWACVGCVECEVEG